MNEERNQFRFAVMGAGNIANKFCDAVSLLKDCQVTAIASKSMERAKTFAANNKIANAYDSYEKMLAEEKPDCVYIGVTTDAHYELSKLCLMHGVPVLCEKAMFVNSCQAEEIFELSRQKQVFVMEAMWSRFLPAVNKAKEWVETGKIGVPVYGDIGIGFHADEDPENRYFNPKLGGGACYDLLVYCYEIMTYMIDWQVDIVQAKAVIGETGVDITDQVTLRFCRPLYPSETKEGVVNPHLHEALVSCESTFMAAMEEKMVLYGNRGKIVLYKPHFASEAFLYDEKGNCLEHYKDTVTKNGFVYEAEEAVNCIREGRIESKIVPHSLTLDCAKLFDKLLQN